VSARGHASTRRLSGHAPRINAQGGAAVALPVRLVNAPFARMARARTSRILDALLSGRGWIALVFLLLAGIVFFNVDLLQMNRDIAQNAERISTLKRENARLLLEEARLANSERVQEEAAALGLVLPAPGQVRYLKARPSRDARRASRNMTEPSSGYVPPGSGETGDPASGTSAAGGETAGSPSGANLDPATGLPIDPATGRTSYDPVTGVAIDPTTGQPFDPNAGAPATGATAPDAATGTTGSTGTTGTTGTPAAGATATTPATGAPAG
jgi:cell division protein FtsL